MKFQEEILFFSCTKLNTTLYELIISINYIIKMSGTLKIIIVPDF